MRKVRTRKLFLPKENKKQFLRYINDTLGRNWDLNKITYYFNERVVSDLAFKVRDIAYTEFGARWLIEERFVGKLPLRKDLYIDDKK